MKIQDLNLAYLKYFIDTVEASSLTRAAEKNHVTRPAISQALCRLEEWTGQRLVTHEKKSFGLTKRGESFYLRAKNAFQNFEKEIESNLHPQRLRIGCSVSLIETLLLPTLSKFDPKNIHLKLGTSSYLMELLKRQEIDLALFIDQESFKDQSREVLLKGKFVLASKTKSFSGTLVTTEERPEVRELLKSLLKKKIEVTSHHVVESWTLSSKIASAFHGACLIPDFLVKPPFVPISIPGFKSSFSVVCARNEKTPQTEAQAKFIELALLGLRQSTGR